MIKLHHSVIVPVILCVTLLSEAFLSEASLSAGLFSVQAEGAGPDTDRPLMIEEPAGLTAPQDPLPGDNYGMKLPGLDRAPGQNSSSGLTWKEIGGHLYLRNSKGKNVKGFVRYQGGSYYFDSSGRMKTGFFTVSGKTYYASRTRGAKGKGLILTGLVRVGSYYYYLDPASSPHAGSVCHGFRYIKGRRYYFNEKGRMLTGWFTVSGSKYYGSCNKSGHYGALLTGVHTIGRIKYLFTSDGKLSANLSRELLSKLRPICQHPALPTGCEVTSLTMVLNYMGLKADKLDLADNYLPKGPVGKVDFRKAFAGNPRNSSSRGCYAPVIVTTANLYLKSRASSLRAVNMSGKELDSLSAYLNQGLPVIVWCTMNCRKAWHSATWVINGKNLYWYSPEHCVVLTGMGADTVTIADPDTGTIRTFNKAVFRTSYNSLFRQAVIIR